MTTENQIKNENDELLSFLDGESKTMNALLSQARDSHYDQLNEKLKQYLSLNIKIGELSLILGAAISPIIIVSNKDISEPIFLFFAITLYLINGIFSIWRAKDFTEKQLDAYSPSILHKLESDVYPLIFSIDKLRFDPKKEEYINEFISCRSTFLEDNTEVEIPNRRIDFTFDINVLIFVLASIFLARIVWPFSNVIYWIFFAGIILLVVGLIVKSYIQAKKRKKQNASNTKKLNELKRTHIEWQKQKFIGGKK